MSIKNKADWSQLHWAVIDNDLATVKDLIRVGADVNERTKNGYTSLHVAAVWNSDVAMTKTLIQFKADINARDIIGWTPLHFAAGKNKNPAIVEALLEAGAHAHAKTNGGQTALDLIQQNDALRHTEAHRKLLALSRR
ncbi:MAG: ankyrin repeat domain-containing protein [Alphaproteobacteria bacterium GM202ARS2]|nr:ankyrin repeat domain-containing protein [Alphaproteobacteria bacterium GM202ARS2]